MCLPYVVVVCKGYFLLFNSRCRYRLADGGERMKTTEQHNPSAFQATPPCCIKWESCYAARVCHKLPSTMCLVKTFFKVLGVVNRYFLFLCKFL